jgi:magnesium transporter
MSDETKHEPLLRAEEALNLAEVSAEELRRRFSDMHSREIATVILDCSDDDQRRRLLLAVPPDLRGETLLELPENMRENLLEMLDPQHIETVVRHLDSDDAADLLQSVEPDVAQAVIERLEPDDRRGLEPLMAHDEETAGGLMQAELFKVRHDWNIAKVLSVLRRWGREIEDLNYAYVVDDDGRYAGVIPLHELLFQEPEVLVGDVMDAEFPRAIAGQDQEEVAHIFDKYDVLALPVVDEDGMLVGRITADDIIDVVQEEATEDMFRLAGLSDADDLTEPLYRSAWRRGIWLFVNLLTAILASYVVSRFQHTIAAIVALAVLMPIVAGMGGNAGTQTLTVVVRGLALGLISFNNARRVLVRQIGIGIINGLALGLIMGAVASIWFPALGWKLGLVIAMAMLTNMCAAGLFGALIPLTLRRIGIDPALASSIFLTTVTDIVGFAAFLGLATMFLL